MCRGPLGSPTWLFGDGAPSADGLPASTRLLQPEESPSYETENQGVLTKPGIETSAGELSLLGQYLLVSLYMHQTRGTCHKGALTQSVMQSLKDLSVQGGGKTRKERDSLLVESQSVSTGAPRAQGSSGQHLRGARLRKISVGTASSQSEGIAECFLIPHLYGAAREMDGDPACHANQGLSPLCCTEIHTVHGGSTGRLFLSPWVSGPSTLSITSCKAFGCRRLISIHYHSVSPAQRGRGVYNTHD